MATTTINKISRKLTVGEIELAKRFYGNRIDYNKVKIHNFKWHVQQDARAMCPNGELYMPYAKDFDDNCYHSDYSSIVEDRFRALNLKWTFIHEMCHAWQFQHGYNVKLNAIRIGASLRYNDNKIYKYDPWKTPRLFKHYNMEQQASIIEDYAKLLYAGRVDINGKYVIPPRSFYEAVLQEFLTNGVDKDMLPEQIWAEDDRDPKDPTKLKLDPSYLRGVL